MSKDSKISKGFTVFFTTAERTGQSIVIIFNYGV